MTTLNYEDLRLLQKLLEMGEVGYDKQVEHLLRDDERGYRKRKHASTKQQFWDMRKKILIMQVERKKTMKEDTGKSKVSFEDVPKKVFDQMTHQERLKKFGLIRDIKKEKETEPRERYSRNVIDKWLKVCGKCGKIYGPWQFKKAPQKITPYQACKCEIKPGEASVSDRWPGFDFNEMVTICYCCGQTLLNSGNKFSCWFCEECRKKVVKFNTMCQQRVVPIGRHSLMAGFHVNTASKDDSKFLKHWKALVDRMGILDKWRKKRVLENIQALCMKEDPNLVRYLEAAAIHNKAHFFKGLIEFYESSKVCIP
jgi:hypothetical protein